MASQRCNRRLGKHGRIGPLAHKSFCGKTLWTRISRVQEALDFGVGSLRLIDKKLTRPKATDIVRESQIRNHNAKQLIVQELASQIKTTCPLSNQVQMNLVGRTMTIRGQSVTFVTVRRDFDADRTDRTG